MLLLGEEGVVLVEEVAQSGEEAPEEGGAKDWLLVAGVVDYGRLGVEGGDGLGE